MKKIIKTTAVIVLSLTCLAGSLFFSNTALAQGSGGSGAAAADQERAFSQSSGLNAATNLPSVIADIIEVVLGLLGVIFIILLVYAGYEWMTASGNEEKIDKAKSTIFRAIIGLAIVIAAYSITYFVFNSLNQSAGTSATEQPL
jgi:amino acid transporter